MKQGMRLGLGGLLGLAIALGLALGWGERAAVGAIAPAPPQLAQTVAAEVMTASPGDGGAAEPGALKPFDEAVKGLAVAKGLFTVYHDLGRNRALLGLTPDQLNQNLLLIATLQSGVGELGLFRGWPVNDFVIQFRQIPDNRVQVVVPNVFFRDPRPQAQRLIQESFSDSILTTLPIQAIHPQTGELLIDLKEFLIGRDLANLPGQFPWVLGSYTVVQDASYLGPIKAFPQNLELETVLSLAGGGSSATPSLFSLGLTGIPDSRGFNLRVRYSLSAIANHPTFMPRPADERVGYFISAYRTPARPGVADPFVRYIHRWHLEKQQPTAALSPPREPLVFWLENTIPPEYRAAVREGVEWWNAAFQQAGFIGAIEVRQMPPNADWDPADVRYNVIRWSDSFANPIEGYGPARVNPLTGEILDADVLLDAGFLSHASLSYDTLAARQGAIAFPQGLCGHPLGDRLIASLGRQGADTPGQSLPPCTGLGAAQTSGFGALALATLAPPFSDRQARVDYIQQYLRALTAHEVGHVLGLRHNFAASTLLSPAELRDPATTQRRGITSSVMDYLPANLTVADQTHADQPRVDYFPNQLGPYDRWAIEYGYRPVGNRITAQRELQVILDRAGDPELAYAPDEDAYAGLDPRASPWDLSSDPLGYAEGQIAIAQAVWSRLNWFSVNPGEGYGQLRQRVDLVFNHFDLQAYLIGNYIGGQHFTRTDPWSSRGAAPFAPLAAAAQRRALAVLNQQVFAPQALDLPPELINRLAPSRWLQWDQDPFWSRIDYPIYDRILLTQGFALSNLLDGYRLLRLRDSSFTQPQADAFTLAELFDTLGQAIWSEVLEPPAQAAPIDSLRQGLQRHHLNILTSLVLRNHGAGAGITDLLGFLAQELTFGAPEEARVLARHQLGQLQAAVDRYLGRHGRRLDTATLAYLEAVGDRIAKVLDAPLISP